MVLAAGPTNSHWHSVKELPRKSTGSTPEKNSTHLINSQSRNVEPSIETTSPSNVWFFAIICQLLYLGGLRFLLISDERTRTKDGLEFVRLQVGESAEQKSAETADG